MMNVTNGSVFSFISVLSGISAQITKYEPVNSVDLMNNHSLNFNYMCDTSNDDLAQFVLNKMFQNYNKDIAPSKRGATQVTIEFIIQAIGHISEISSSFTLDLSSVLADMARRTVELNYRLQVVGACEMDLALYPVDIQICELIIESYAFNNEKVSLAWRSFDPVFSISKNRMADYNLYSLRWRKSTFDYAAGSWDQLFITLSFSRTFGFFVLQVYVPTSCLVGIGFISFWIDLKSLPARITLTMTSLMALTYQCKSAEMGYTTVKMSERLRFQRIKRQISLRFSANSLIFTVFEHFYGQCLYGNVARSLPKSGYIKSVDVYFTVTTLFLCATMLEVAIVCYVEKKNALQKQQQELEKKTKRIEQFKRATNSYGKTSCDIRIPEEEFDENDELRSPNTTYGSMDNRSRNEFDDPRLRKESFFFGDENKRNGNVANPVSRKTSWANFLGSKRRNGSFGLDPLHLLTSLSFSLGMHPELDVTIEPNWTGERIDSLSRRFFPIAFTLFLIVYWSYYLTLNHFAKERALNSTDEL